MDVVDLGELHNLVNGFLRILRVDALELGGEIQVFARGHVGVSGGCSEQIADGPFGLFGLLENIMAVDDDLALRGPMYPVIMFIVVVFPAPFGPRKP